MNSFKAFLKIMSLLAWLYSMTLILMSAMIGVETAHDPEFAMRGILIAGLINIVIVGWLFSREIQRGSDS